MSTWAEVDEAARRMAVDALDRMGWALIPTSSGHVWLARPADTFQIPRTRVEAEGMVQSMTAVGLVEAVQAKIEADSRCRPWEL